MKFDAFLATVGDWGKFQKVKYTLICLTYMLPPIMVYTYTFTAATPDFRCQNPTTGSEDRYINTSNLAFKARYTPTEAQCKAQQNGISLKECQRCFRQPDHVTGNLTDAQLQRCGKYVYSKDNYENTLVEEVTPRARASCHTLPCIVEYGL